MFRQLKLLRMSALPPLRCPLCANRRDRICCTPLLSATDACTHWRRLPTNSRIAVPIRKTFRGAIGMSALPPKADMCGARLMLDKRSGVVAYAVVKTRGPSVLTSTTIRYLG